MFKNIGRKIKMLARVICAIGILASVIGGGILCSNAISYHEDAALLGGIAVIVLGSIVSWVGSFFTYGFGELIDCASELAGHSRSKQEPRTPAILSPEEESLLARLQAEQAEQAGQSEPPAPPQTLDAP